MYINLPHVDERFVQWQIIAVSGNLWSCTESLQSIWQNTLTFEKQAPNAVA